MAPLGMTITVDASQFEVGDVVQLHDGNRYRVTKKTSTALAVVPYHWWDKVIDWYKLHIRGNGGTRPRFV